MVRFQQGPDRSGEQHGAWTVIQRSHSDRFRNVYWLCRCMCGAERIVMGARLVAGLSYQCGTCYRRINAPSVMVSWGGQIMNLKAWCALLGIPHKRVYRRRHDGWSLLRCLTTGADPIVLQRLKLESVPEPVQVSTWTATAAHWTNHLGSASDTLESGALHPEKTEEKRYHHEQDQLPSGRRDTSRR